MTDNDPKGDLYRRAGIADECEPCVTPAWNLSQTQAYTFPQRPNPADVKPGEAWLVRDEQELSVAVRDAERWVLIRLDDATIRYRRIQHITLVSRLVPTPRTVTTDPAPRTVTTPDDLDALPTGTVVLDTDGDACQKTERGWQVVGLDRYYTQFSEFRYPFTVIYTPQEDA